jgi:type IV secretory pathway VirB6-like protein
LNFTTDIDGLLLDGVGDSVQGGLEWVRVPMRAALMLYVIIQAGNATMGHASGRSVITAAVRAIVIAAMLQAEHFVPWVQEAALTTIPAQLAEAWHGSVIAVGAALQFDILRDALQKVAAELLMQASGPLNIVARGIIHLLGVFGSGGIFLMWLFWYVPILLTGIVIPLGPFLVPFFLFRATRAFAETWVAKLISLMVLQLAGSVLMQLLLTSIQHRITAMRGTAGMDLDQMIWNFAGMNLLMWFGAIMMLVLPLAITIGSGVGAASLSIIGYTTAMMKAPVRAAGAVIGRLG